VKDFRSFDYDVIVGTAMNTVAQYAVDDDGMLFVVPDDGFKFLSWDRIRMYRDVAKFVCKNAYDLRKMRNIVIGVNFGLQRAGFHAEWSTLTSDEPSASDRLEKACNKYPTLFPAWSRDFKDTLVL
jgi:hypothetical protein